MEKLIYSTPAQLWRDALPLGNGDTGVMIYGGKKKERLSFNNCTLWSGYPKNQNNSESFAYLNKVRKLAFDGKNTEADKLCMNKLCGAYSEGFLPLGDIELFFSRQNYSGYRRELNIEKALHTVSFNGVKREAFCSYPDKITALRIKSKTPFSVKIKAQSKLHSEIRTDDGLNLIGNVPDYVAPNYLKTERHPVHYEQGMGMSFCLRCEVLCDGCKQIFDKSITVSDAHELTLFISTATGYIDFDKKPETSMEFSLLKCKDILKKAPRDYELLRQRHITDYKAIYDKQSIGFRNEVEITTDKLISDAKRGNTSPALCELLYNFGKYLMISGSREGGQALNLQGLWNNRVRPPWSSNYTTNINTEMNYWCLTKSNLSECAEPYIRLVRNIMKNGQKTAKINYGCEGFCCNHNVDIWCKTTPVKGSPSYMYAPLCGAWLSNELYSHYKNGGLEKYKTEILETVTEAAKFINEYLVFHKGFYVTAPSASPEAAFVRNGKNAELDYASTFEMSIAKQCFLNYLEFKNDALAYEIRRKLPLFYPMKLGNTGILEWHDDVPITERGHRHFSPLYGFYPANIIKYHSDKEQTQWVKKLFDYRMDNSKQYIGWSAAWAICISGRLHDAVRAESVINSMLAHSVFKNLFCVHPPFFFQIDGNMGFIAGINELLAYEENGIVELLPALPKSLPNGSAENLIVNGVQLSFEWKNGEIIRISADRKTRVLHQHIAKSVLINENIILEENDYEKGY